MQQIHGTAAAGSKVRVINAVGAVLANTTADIHGEWDAGDLPLEAGDVVKAEIVETSGRQHSTAWLTIEAEEPAATPEPQVDAAIRDRLLTRYAIILGELVDGADVDYRYFCDVAHALGKSAVDVHADIEALDREKRLTRLEAIITERTSQR